MSMAGPHGSDPDDRTTSGPEGHGGRLGPGDLAPDEERLLAALERDARGLAELRPLLRAQRRARLLVHGVAFGLGDAHRAGQGQPEPVAGEALLREARLDLLQRPRGRRGLLAGLEDHRVSGGEAGDQGGEREVDGVVPGTEDQRDAARLGHHPAA